MHHANIMLEKSEGANGLWLVHRPTLTSKISYIIITDRLPDHRHWLWYLIKNTDGTSNKTTTGVEPMTYWRPISFRHINKYTTVAQLYYHQIFWNISIWQLFETYTGSTYSKQWSTSQKGTIESNIMHLALSKSHIWHETLITSYLEKESGMTRFCQLAGPLLRVLSSKKLTGHISGTCCLAYDFTFL